MFGHWLLMQVCRVYIGSFNGTKPIREDINPQCKPLFEKEQADLLSDLYEIPHRSCDRKVPNVAVICCLQRACYDMVTRPWSAEMHYRAAICIGQEDRQMHHDQCLLKAEPAHSLVHPQASNKLCHPHGVIRPQVPLEDRCLQSGVVA